MSNNEYDILILGTGPGGYTAAFEATKLGAKVLLIEKDELGGTCLNCGCIPTKSLLYSTELFSKFQKANSFGITADNINFDWEKMINRKDQVVTKLRRGLEFSFKKKEIAFIKGEGRLISPHEIKVADQVFKGKSIIIATGSSPITKNETITSTEALNLKTLPETLNILGGGVMGVEFATIFSELGVKVTLIEAQERILPAEDPETSLFLTQILKRKGVKIKCQTSEFEKDSLTLTTIGRKLNTEAFADLSLVKKREALKVDQRMQTSMANIYAVGDITGPPLLAHTAIAEGKVAAQNACGKESLIDYEAIPWTIFTHPEIARVGKTWGDNLRTVKLPFGYLGKAQIMGEIEGFFKIAVNESNQIVGITIMGVHASDLIGEATLAVKEKITVEKFKKIIHAHPTLYEGLFETIDLLP